MDGLKHVPVMLEECLNGISLKDGGQYFDGTLGGAGHSYEILKRTSPNGRLLATDLDDYAISRATERLKEFDGRFTLVKDNFKNFSAVADAAGVDKFDGIILDLGVSSFQLDDKSRGFSYLGNSEPLDMRMSKDSPFSAKDLVNTFGESELTRIFYEYGEERFSGLIAKKIVEYRKKKAVETCGELVKIIEEAVPKKFQTNGHPAKKVFQAIRIAVNGELDGLYEAVLSMARRLKVGGRMVVLTFHSLEDRIVKNAFRELEKDCICPKNIPFCVCDKVKEVEILTKHPIVALDKEREGNPRSKSAKLRVLEKIKEEKKHAYGKEK